MDTVDFREIFAEEAINHLAAFENGILLLEKNSDDAGAINDIFRAVHTLKGASAMVSMVTTSGFAHAAESFLDVVRAGELKLNHATIGLLLSVHDALKLTVEREAVGAVDADLKTDLQKLSDSLQSSLGGGEKNTPAKQIAAAVPPVPEQVVHRRVSYNVQIRCRGEMPQHGFDPLSFIRYLKTMGEITDCRIIPEFTEKFDPEILYLGFDVWLETTKSVAEIREVFALAGDLVAIKIVSLDSAEEMTTAVETQPNQDPVTETQKVAANIKQKNYLRIESERLDSLIDSIGELVMTGAALKSLQPVNVEERYQDQLTLLERQVETMRDSAMQLRTFSLNEVFRRFERVVRDVSAQAGKEVKLEISGGETEIDKNLMDGVYDPLVHIIRNSVDHGIESAEERLARGKSPVGKITVRAERMAGMIYITVEDDGTGPNLAKIEKRARERGLLKDGQPTEKELIEMVFQPGFSTAEKITALSGRGVGMDVVRQNVTKLNGSVNMSRGAGGGTVVSIRLPLTLAIIDGLLVESGINRYVIPLDQVIECIDYDEFGAEADALSTGVFSLRGEALPVISLAGLFHEENMRARVVVVAQTGDKRYGLFIDKPLGELQIVVKPIENIPGIPRLFNGATILGDGRVALILDLSNLVESARRSSENIYRGNLSPTEAVIA